MRISRFVVIAVCFASPVIAAEPASIAPFTLPDADGKPVSPLDAKNQKALVVAFMNFDRVR